MLSKIPARYLSVLALLVWGGAVLGLGLLRFDPYGVDEGAARTLLLSWTVWSNVMSPAITYGYPDARFALFTPLGLYWPGSLVAAKVFTLVLGFGAALFLYRWSRERLGGESALIATGLLLIAPMTFILADSLAIGPYLLFMFGLGMWLDQKYRSTGYGINSWYFLQAILVGATVSLHPMGLAYPLALAWHWYRTPGSQTQQRQVWIALGIAVFVVLVMRAAWISADWFSNPLISLGQWVIGAGGGDPADMGYAWGVVPALLVMAVVLRDARNLLSDLMGTMLLLALVIGLCAADASWSLVALVVFLYRGIAQLVILNERLGKNGFAGQRGLVFVAILVLSTLFMQADKAYANLVKNELLSPQDQLIQTLALEAEDPKKPFRAASQWPARSMLVCKRDVLPLPRALTNGSDLLAQMKGITHVVFDHRDPRYSALAKNFAEIAAATETLSIQQSGVLIRLREGAPAATPHAPSAPASNNNGT